MSVDYSHSANLHTLDGPRTALPRLFAEGKPSSLLDVGCGTGTWLKATSELGIRDFFGVDGVKIPPEKLHVPAEKIRHQDLTIPWNLGRRFEMAICLEVAEHLDEPFAPVLIDALAQHTDFIYFSAACPGQQGQHHVNCQWPAYWQQFFNQRGFVCVDEVRWQIWDDARIEPWYRQNIFSARRNSALAGQEPRIQAVLHPEMLPSILTGNKHYLKKIEKGGMEAKWYLKTPVRALAEKLKKRIS